MSRKRSRRSDSNRNDSKGDKYRSSRSSARDQAASSAWRFLRIAIPIVALAACGAAAFIMSRNGQTPPPGNTTSLPVATAQPTTTAGGPRWVCDQPLIDFGQVWEGATVQKEFTFRNTGDQLLKIEKPKAHCSCSSAPNYTKEVPPGGSGVIPFVLQTANKAYGPLEEYLNIETNDPKARSVQVRLKGFIKNVLEPEVVYDATYQEDVAAGQKPLEVAKTKGAFGRIKGDRALHRVVKLRNTSGQPLTLSMIAPEPKPPFTAELVEKVAGEEFDLTIKATPPIPIGHTTASVILQTNVPERPRYILWISSYVAPRIEVSPPDKMLIDAERFPQKEREIRIANNGQTPVDVVGISTSEPRFGFTLQPRDPKLMNQQIIKIALPGGESYRPPPYGEVIEITTNDAEVPLIRITVVPTMNPTPRPPDKPLVMHEVPLTPGGG
ncbi:MAG: DUF1573 domain-containing protein [Planctomycetes bacterium]|nr:DUF1573 domain-containing protein [Planctomycetota bacterium]